MLTWNHIAEWLIKEKELTLSGFGSFKLENIPAKIHPVEHSFSPPIQLITFTYNKSQKNDSILTQIISSTFKFSKEEANNQINGLVLKLIENIKTQGSVVIDNVGSFSLVGDKVTFVFDKNSTVNAANFGLSTFQQDFISRRKIQDPSVKKKKPFYLKAAFWIVILILIIGSTVFTTLYLNDFQLFNDKKTDITPPISKKTEVKPTEIKNREKDTLNIQNKPVKDSIPSNAEVFYIIYGCYKEESNAQKAVKQLVQKGYPEATVCGTNNNGFFKVSYGKYKSKANAEEMLKSIKEKGPTEAWISK